jgi:hypothetical protein
MELPPIQLHSFKTVVTYSGSATLHKVYPFRSATNSLFLFFLSAYTIRLCSFGQEIIGPFSLFVTVQKDIPVHWPCDFPCRRIEFKRNDAQLNDLVLGVVQASCLGIQAKGYP